MTHSAKHNLDGIAHEAAQLDEAIPTGLQRPKYAHNGQHYLVAVLLTDANGRKHPLNVLCVNLTQAEKARKNEAVDRALTAVRSAYPYYRTCVWTKAVTTDDSPTQKMTQGVGDTYWIENSTLY